MGQKVHAGRFAADPPDGTVLFLIGMRINKWWKIHRWIPPFYAMLPMLRELARQSDRGYLGHHIWLGRTTVIIQYWKGMDELMAYARDAGAGHVPGWRNFNRNVGNGGDVGVWHEAYATHPDQLHIIYRNMPEFGMAKATEHVHRSGSGPVRATGSHTSRNVEK